MSCESQSLCTWVTAAKYWSRPFTDAQVTTVVGRTAVCTVVSGHMNSVAEHWGQKCSPAADTQNCLNEAECPASSIMSTYHKAGFLDTTTADGQKLRVIYLHDARSRNEAKVHQEVEVLRSFAAACARGDKDVTGRSLPAPNNQCAVIWVRKSHHASISDRRPHLAVQISTEEQFNETPRVALSGLHVYSRHNRTSHGYSGWRKVGELRRSKMSSVAIQERIADALSNDFGAEPRRPSPPSSPVNSEPAEEPQ